MTPQLSSTLGLVLCLAPVGFHSPVAVAHASQPVAAVPDNGPDIAPDTADWREYQFVCEDDGLGLSVVDVLEAGGDHATFLGLFREHDPEGFESLADPVLADKTVWAPTDAAFAEVDDSLSTLTGDEIMAILGYHVTPPRRTPEGPYPIVTPRFLADGGTLVHQTRTGILTGSDQRLRTTARDGVLTVQDAPILPTSWCTQTGSVFAIDTVIMDVPTASVVERVIYVVFFQYPLLVVLGVGALIASLVLYLRTRANRRRRHP